MVNFAGNLGLKATVFLLRFQSVANIKYQTSASYPTNAFLCAGASDPFWPVYLVD